MKQRRCMKVLVIAIVISLFSTSFVFAESSIDAPSVSDIVAAENTADDLDEVIDEDEVVDDVERTGEGFVLDSNGNEVLMPLDSDDTVDVSLEDGETISNTLPLEVETTDGISTENGTIIYEGEENVDVAVQALEIKQDDLVLSGVRTAVSIADKDAPKEYSFEYDLPDGYKLITAEELYGPDTTEKGYVYIVNTQSTLVDEEGNPLEDIVMAIEPAWAKDANQSDVYTYYKIAGNTLIQVVEFNENSAFPIIADPKATTKPKSKKISSEKTTVNLDHKVAGIASLFTILSGKIPNKLRDKALKAIAKKLGSKFIPVLGNATGVVMTYSTVQDLRGYRYTRATITFDVWTSYKRQSGRWVKGYYYKNVKIKLKLIK